MKYMLLIHQGDAPTPRSEEWESLSEDDRGAVYGAYKALNETPGVSPGLQLQPPETATTVRVQDGKTLTTDGRSPRSRRRSATRTARRSGTRRRSPTDMALVHDDAERRLLERRLAELGAAPGPARR